MDVSIAALVLPYINSNKAWLDFVSAVNKQYALELDIDCNWEEHFQMSCKDFLSPFARFMFIRSGGCKMHKSPRYDASLSMRYQISFSFDSKKCFARQAFRQFFIVQGMLDEHFTHYSPPFAVFSCKPVGTLKLPSDCASSCLGCELMLLRFFDHPDPPPLVHGDLSHLYAELSAELDYSSDESWECSECGEEHHRWDSWM